MAEPTRSAKRGDRASFERIKVGKCFAQTADDRFGDGGLRAVRDRERAVIGQHYLGDEAPFDWPVINEFDTDDHDGSNSIFRLVPAMRTHRNNLTALSAVHNLYFVAYINQIFVYRPQAGVRCNLSSRPDLRIRIEMSSQGKMAGGFIDQQFGGQTINHLITGFLGDREIVLVCTDNGDVVAYDTQHIADIVFREAAPSEGLDDLTEKRRKGASAKRRKLRPFFHQNVCKTAWGLGIHQKSRLIAVSTNLAEVTVFALSQVGAPVEQHTRFHGIEGRVRERFRTWRIIVSLGSDADNLPNLCFLDNEQGYAEKIGAIDINGTAWIANIWKAKSPAIRLGATVDDRMRSEESFPQRSRGWGILGLRKAHFLRVHTVEDLIGMPRSNIEFTPINGRANLHASLESIPDNPCTPSFVDRVPGTLLSDLNNNNIHIPGFNDEQFPESTEEEGEEEDDDEDDGGMDEESDDEVDQDVEDDFDDEAEEGMGGGVSLVNNGGPVGAESDITTVEGLMAALDQYDTDHPSEIVSEDEEQGEGQGEEQEVEEGAQTFTPPDIDGAQAIPALLNNTIGQPDFFPPNNFFANQSAPSFGPFLTSSPGVTTGNAATPQAPNAQQNPPPPPLSLPWVLTLPAEFQGAFGELGTALGELESAVQAMGQNNIQFMAAGPPPPKRAHRLISYQDAKRVRSLDDVRDIPANWMYRPHEGQTAEEPWDDRTRRMFVQSRNERNRILGSFEQAAQGLASGYVMLRSYEKDFEMVPLSRNRGNNQHEEIRMVCTGALTCEFSRQMGVQRFFRATSRLSMLAHIPELFLVILGSPTGRVVLVTPTRMAKPVKMESEHFQWDRGMRLECILPRRSEERVHRRAASPRPLYGLAVGPVLSEEKNAGESDATLPKRFRIMLHYQNHMILTYELTRHEQTQKLLVF